MAASCLIAATLVGLALAGCSNILPRPDYVDFQTPAAFRTQQPGGARIDNADYRLDAEGYRVDKQGERIGMIDVPAKTEGDNSNAVAGYYISSTGTGGPRAASPRPAISWPRRAASRCRRRCRSRSRSPRRRPMCRRRPAIAEFQLAARHCSGAIFSEAAKVARLASRARAQPYSIFTPAARITGAHLAISSLMNFAVRSGVVSVVGTAAMSSRNLIMSASAMILREAWSSVSTTG